MRLLERVKPQAAFSSLEVLAESATQLMVRLYDLRYMGVDQKHADSLHRDAGALRDAIENMGRKT